MSCHSQIVSVTPWTFALIFCAWISVQLGREIPRSMSQQWVTDVAAALSGARLYKLPPASADQSHRPDMIEFGDLHALALSRDKLAVATARRKCRDLRRRRWTQSNRDSTVTVCMCTYFWQIYGPYFDQKYVHIRAARICTYNYKYVHIRTARICTYFRTNTYIYVQIRSVGVPSRVSVSARIHWKYIHIRLRSTQHTAPL